MADEYISTPTDTSKVIDAMIEVLKAATCPEIMQAQILLMRRFALSGDLFPSRIPAPQNITEIGGYLNLLEKLDQPELRSQVLASILGVAGPNLSSTWSTSGPVLFFVNRTNDRPVGSQQAAIQVQFSIRSDFAAGFDTVLKNIHDRGCQLPILSPVRFLPPTIGEALPIDLLHFIGRTLQLSPSAALMDPDNDPFALARLTAGGDLQVVARQLDPVAPLSAEVVAQDWTAWQCDAAACHETVGNRSFYEIQPVLNSAEWYQQTPTVPASLSNQGSWGRWANVTGMVVGVTRYGDELGLLFTQPEIVASALRDYISWIWNGSEFIKI